MFSTALLCVVLLSLTFVSGAAADTAAFSVGPSTYRLDGTPGDYLGVAVDGAGDVNGDGLQDFIVGAPTASGQPFGTAYVVFGDKSKRGPNLDPLHARGFRITGAQPAFGAAVAGAGDVNGDGLADVAVGAGGAGHNDRPGSGSVYVVFGASNTDPVNADALGKRGFRVDGPAVSAEAGRSVDGAGDVNKDGYADIVIGAPFNSANGITYSGSAYVVFGAAGSQDVDLANLGSQGFAIDGGPPPGNFFGLSVAGAGDVNNDGMSDVVVGRPQDNTGTTYHGQAFVVFGRSGSAAVSVGQPDFGGFRIDGSPELSDLGWSIAGAGDTNGDGRADVVVGSRFSGAVVVFGASDTNAVTASIPGSRGFVIRPEGSCCQAQAGFSATGIGDVNMDGRADIALGAPGARANTGSVFVVFGKATGGSVDAADLRDRGFRIDGEVPGDNFGNGVAAVPSAGTNDSPGLLVGAPSARANSGSAYLLRR